MEFCNCSMFCSALLFIHSSFAIIIAGCFTLWCLVIVVWLFLTMSRICLQFVIVVFPDHTHLLFMIKFPFTHHYPTSSASPLNILLTQMSMSCSGMIKFPFTQPYSISSSFFFHPFLSRSESSCFFHGSVSRQRLDSILFVCNLEGITAGW